MSSAAWSAKPGNLREELADRLALVAGQVEADLAVRRSVFAGHVAEDRRVGRAAGDERGDGRRRRDDERDDGDG